MTTTANESNDRDDPIRGEKYQVIFDDNLLFYQRPHLRETDKEVSEMEKKESPCGCGCIGAKPSLNKAAKSLKVVEAKEAKNQQNKKIK